jgi:hypothetical protein
MRNPLVNGSNDDFSVAFDRALHRRPKRRPVKHRFGKGTLIFNRQADNLGLLDRAICGLLRRRCYKIAHAAALDLRRALDRGERIGLGQGCRRTVQIAIRPSSPSTV